MIEAPTMEVALDRCLCCGGSGYITFAQYDTLPRTLKTYRLWTKIADLEFRSTDVRAACPMCRETGKQSVAMENLLSQP